MQDIEILARLLLALGFGAVLGLETETRSSSDHLSEKEKATRAKQRIGGVRTYTILTLFGAISGVLFITGMELFAYLTFIGVFLLVLAAYVLNVQYNKAFGLTTEMAIMVSVLVGFATTSGLISIPILIAVILVLAFILSQKRGITLLASQIEHDELRDVLTFAILIVVIAPFLPNQDYTLGYFPTLMNFLKTIGINYPGVENLILINPLKMWQIVILISGISLAGYVAAKLWGEKRGPIISAMISGLVSSTSAFISLAHDTKLRPNLSRRYAALALLAHSTSFVTIVALAASFGASYLRVIIPISLMLVFASLVICVYFLQNGENGKDEGLHIKHEPFTIGPALKFAVLLTFLSVALQIVNYLLGANATVLATALTGLVGMDPATITLGQLFNNSTLPAVVIGFTFLAANLVNYGAKVVYVYIQGDRTFTRLVSWGLLVSAVAGTVGVMVQFLLNR